MRKVILLTLLALFFCGSVFAQENKTEKKGKKKQKTEATVDGENPADNATIVNEDSDDDDIDNTFLFHIELIVMISPCAACH